LRISTHPLRVARQLAAYPLIILLTLGTSAILYLFRESISLAVVAVVYLVPVTIGAVWWGLGPGVSSAVAAFLAFNYLFIQPYYTFEVHSSGDWVVLAAFLAVAFVISELMGRIRANLGLAMAREAEALRLFELSTALARLRDEKSVAEALMEKAIDTLQADRVEVSIEAVPNSLAFARGMKFKRKPDAIIPLQAARDLLGEIRLWRIRPDIQPAEERILQTFASQGVLAIERIRLSNADRKARVLEESDRLKSSLLSSVSHELRSPLAAIKASVSSLRSGEVEWGSEARTDLLATVEEEIDHLNVLVGNLLDMSRIEAGALKPQKKPNMLAEIVEAVLARMRSQTQNHRIEVEVRDDLPLVNVDFVQMEQVFTNLLSNSLKYSPPGSTIRISVHQKDEHALLARLTNQSIPVPETDLERIFDKFYRINPSERVTGSGLGLSITKGIIEAHGGRIWAENLPDGLTFNFIIPV
jgi:two-component system sensor histidine kinase KdpD